MSDENDLLIAPAPEEETETMDMEDMDMDHMDMDGDWEEHDMDGHMMMEEMHSPFKHMMKIAKMMDWSAIDTTTGQMAYLFTAGFACAHYSLLAFRYFGKAERYDIYTVDKSTGTQWFELGSKMINFTSLAVYGVAFITSLLALLGIAPSINYMVWFWGVMVLGGGANMIGEMLMFIGMDGAYSDFADTATDAKTVAKAAIGGAVYVNIRQAMVEEMVTQTKIMYVLYNQGENWMWAMWDAMPQAEKEAKVEELMMEVEEWEKEMMAEMEAEMDMEEDAEESADDAEEADEDADEADKDADEADEDADEDADEADEDADEADEDDFGGDDGFGDDDGFGGDDGFGDDDSFDDFFN